MCSTSCVDSTPFFATPFFDYRLRVIGERGVLEIDDCWFWSNCAGAGSYEDACCSRRLTAACAWRAPEKQSKRRGAAGGAAAMDFARGIAELADAVSEQRTVRLSPRFSLHINELSLAIQNAGPEGSGYRMQSRFEPIEPMPWAV